MKYWDHKHARKPGDIPTTPHWAIVRYDSITSDDTYGGFNNEEVTRYHVYKTEAEWKAAIQFIEELKRESTYGRDYKYIAFHVDAVARTSVKIEVEVST